ncbi:MAG: hypothetical protein K8Q89_00960 [Nitrosarchaeum sp.]|nr:hypothetical protein [Nitrosarchaeum sp.]
MKQTLYLKINSTFNPSLIVQTSEAAYLQILLGELSQKDYKIFKQIIIAIKTNSDTQSVILASELARIRILEKNICMTLELLQHFKTKNLCLLAYHGIKK